MMLDYVASKTLNDILIEAILNDFHTSVLVLGLIYETISVYELSETNHSNHNADWITALFYEIKYSIAKYLSFLKKCWL